LVIEASAARAGEAMQALRRAGSLSDLRLEGVVDRDLADGSTAVERFRLSALLRRALPAGPDAPHPALRAPSAGETATEESDPARPAERPLVRMRP
ncbi:MAG: hypothetical protein L0271_03385, partial [Gemmatimonadetes bacterium]|nr:hypothetical protein [Gemmatimonadota bacterium]